MTIPSSISRWLLRLTLAVGLVASVRVAEVGGQGNTYTWTDERGVVHFSNSQVPAQHMASAEVRANAVVPTPGRRAQKSSTIPLISRDQKRFVRARLEGRSNVREVVMLVDTGAQMTMIDEGTAADLGVEFVEQVGIVGVTGTSNGWIGQLRRVELGDKEVRDWRVMVGPVPGMLLLGMDMLEKLQLTVASEYLESR